MKHRLQTVASLLLLLLLWQGLSMLIGRSIILPSPWMVMHSVMTLLINQTTYIHLMTTFFRAHIALLISLCVGFGLAYGTSKLQWMEALIQPWIRIIQTIPQISFIILLMFMTKPQEAMVFVIVLMLFPVAYYSFRQGFKTIDERYRDLMQLDTQPWYRNLYKIYMPLQKDTLFTLLESLIPMSLKIAVMSEVLIYTQVGLGHVLNHARANIDMPLVFAYTVILVGACFIETLIIRKGYRR